MASNIEIINRAAYTPKVCIHDVLHRMEEAKVERILVMLQTSDGSVETYTSHMSISSIAYLSKCLDRRVYNLIEASTERG